MKLKGNYWIYIIAGIIIIGAILYYTGVFKKSEPATKGKVIPMQNTANQDSSAATEQNK